MIILSVPYRLTALFARIGAVACLPDLPFVSPDCHRSLKSLADNLASIKSSSAMGMFVFHHSLLVDFMISVT